METLDTDQELTNEKAARLQVHSGNEAIQDLIDQLSNLDQALTDLETELEVEEKKENEETENEVDEGEEIDVTPHSNNAEVVMVVTLRMMRSLGARVFLWWR